MKSKLFYLTLAIAVITFIMNIVAYPFLPDKVPVHWGWKGEVDQNGSRIEQMVMGGLPLILVFFLKYVPLLDPKKESYKKHSNAYAIMNL